MPPFSSSSPAAASSPTLSRVTAARVPWTAVSIAAAAVLLGAHGWRSYAVLRDAMPDPLREAAVGRVPLGPTAIVSTIFVPDCATALAVRFDPSSPRQGDVTLRLAVQQRGNRFDDTPIFEATGRLEAMPTGEWTVHPPMQAMRARFVRLTLQARGQAGGQATGQAGRQAAADARGSILVRAALPRDRQRPRIDDRWAPRASPIAGALMAHADPLACVAAGEPLPRPLVLPGLLFLTAVWALTLGVIAMWLWPRRPAPPPQSAARPVSRS